jgi:hypothetical protein
MRFLTFDFYSSIIPTYGPDSRPKAVLPMASYSPSKSTIFEFQRGQCGSEKYEMFVAMLPNNFFCYLITYNHWQVSFCTLYSIN